MVNLGAGVSVTAGLAIGSAFVVMFSILFSVMPFQNATTQEPAISTVRILKDASTGTGLNSGYEPKVITVKIGINNTVQWVNEDVVPHGIPTLDDDGSDPVFAKAVQREKENYPFILPKGDSFQHTFTKAGKFNYHMEPHPWMGGTVIVLPPFP